jgi:hypothetical protein
MGGFMYGNAKSYIGLSLITASSFGAGYLVALGVNAKKTEKEIERQVKAAHAYYAKQYKQGEYSTPQSSREALLEEGELFKNALEGMADYQTVKEGGDIPEGEEDNRIILENDAGRIIQNVENMSLTLEGPRKRVMPQKEDLDEVIEKLEKNGAIKKGARAKTNIFADPRPPVNVGEEQEPDVPKRPYLVSQAVFTEPNEAYTLAEYTVYAGDNTVANDQDEPLDAAEVDRIIGDENLNQFGYLEEDPHVVLIRNDELMLNIEVTLVETKFGEKVAGFVPEGDDG